MSKPEYETDNSLNAAEAANRGALGFSALAITGTAMFTALAAYTGNESSAIIYGTSLTAQCGLGLLNGGHVWFAPRAARGENADRQAVSRHCSGAFKRMAGIAVIACTTALLAPPSELNIPVAAAITSTATP